MVERGALHEFINQARAIINQCQSAADVAMDAPDYDVIFMTL